MSGGMLSTVYLFVALLSAFAAGGNASMLVERRNKASAFGLAVGFMAAFYFAARSQGWSL